MTDRIPDEGGERLETRTVRLADQDGSSRYFGLYFSEHLTDTDVLKIAEGRGLAVGVLGSRALTAAQSWLADQYEVNEAALRDLGFGQQLEEAPQFDDVLDHFSIPNLIKVERRRKMGLEDSLVIYPSLREVGLVGTPGNPGYVPRFDRKQGEEVKTNVLEEFWSQYNGDDHESKAEQNGKWNIALMMDSRMSTDDDVPFTQTDMYGSRGVAYTKLRSDEQREMLEHDQEDHEFSEDFSIISASVGQIIVRNAQRRLLGESLLDNEKTFTRLVQYPDKEYAHRRHTACIGSDAKGQLFLGASPALERSLRGGIRKALIAKKDYSSES